MDIEEKKYFIIQNLKLDITESLTYEINNFLNISPNEYTCNTFKIQSDLYLLLLKEINTLYKDSKKLSMPTCEHIFKSGSRKGSKCTTLVKRPGDFCSKHKPKISIEENDDGIEDLPLKDETNNIKKEKETICTIRKNKFNNFVFKNTRLIFRSQKEKYIVAKEDLKGEWLPLNEDDIQICKENHLRYKIIEFNKKSQESNTIDLIKDLVKLPFENISSKQQTIKQRNEETDDEKI
jgi:hypothetical protein